MNKSKTEYQITYVKLQPESTLFHSHSDQHNTFVIELFSYLVFFEFVWMGDTRGNNDHRRS